MLTSSLAISDDFVYFDRFFDRVREIEIEPMAAVMGGLAFAKVDASANYDVGFTTYDYDSHQDTQTRGAWGALLGGEFEWNDDWFLQSGIAYYQTSPFSSKGNLTPDAGQLSPPVYDYHFKIRTYQIMWETKFLTEWKEKYHPYFIVGIGAAINRSEEYSDNVDPLLIFTPQYEDKTETSFSYSVGLGVDYDIIEESLRLGLGYRLTDLGKAGLEKSSLDATNLEHSLEKHQLYNQEILLQLTYVFS